MSQENSRVETPVYAWMILVVAYLAFFAYALVFQKVAPLMPSLMEAFSVTMGRAGLLVSVFGLAALFFILPAGMMLQRLGLKTTGVIALALTTVGAALGAVSDGFGLLLFSRVLQGIGGGLIVVVTPAAVAMWFPPEKVGVPMGVYSTAMPVAGFVIMSAAPILEPSIGWNGVWWLTGGVAVVALVVYWVFMRSAPVPAGAEEGPSPDEASQSGPSPLRIALGNKNICLLAAGMLCQCAPFFALVTYYPTYLSTEVGFSIVRAGVITGMIGLVTIPGAPLVGLISDKIGSRKWVILVGLLILVPAFALSFQVSEGTVMIMVLLLGINAGAVPPMIMAAAPEAMDDVKLAGIGMALVILGMMLGAVVGPAVFGPLAESVGYTKAGYVLTSVIILGIVLMAMYKPPRR